MLFLNHVFALLAIHAMFAVQRPMLNYLLLKTRGLLLFLQEVIQPFDFLIRNIFVYTEEPLIDREKFNNETSDNKN